jgi:hypothetical protein
LRRLAFFRAGLAVRRTEASLAHDFTLLLR